MFTVTSYTVEKLKDPFNILPGERYEFVLELEVEEDDELYHDEGVSLRVVYMKDNNEERVVKYEFQKTTTGGYINMELEEEELALVRSLCHKELFGPTAE
ncbi:pullulanase [Paenibacillus sp. MY03]|jgi:hypothetical protein|uniref:DUF6509 family protein n=1 Tax=Paenibacillus sp. MY03 TaxID=302980 RepID=UPI000B3D3310|nr:DUF6509 family protein [Paenibacillus sp. MY03]OUS78721.1 pullulanase [Paenibacillus sp. MY03]